jgi:hypothetical protein
MASSAEPLGAACVCIQAQPERARKVERTKESGLAGMGGAAAASRNGGDPLSRGLRRGLGG